MATAFDRPIPGQSLTTEPRNNPWEQPPQMSSVEDVTKYYIERLANQEVLDDFAAICEAGVAISPIVEATYMQGVSRGLHTIDAGILVAPILHTFLKQAIESMGVTVKDDSIDYEKKAEGKELNRFMLLASKYLDDNANNMGDPGVQMLSELVNEDEPMMEDEPMGMEDDMGDMENEAVEEPMGLMARG
mgnify:CR=1 FL=1